MEMRRSIFGAEQECDIFETNESKGTFFSVRFKVFFDRIYQFW